MVKLGVKYIDKLTDFEGIATQQTEYLDGTTQVLLERGSSDGSHHSVWFDSERLFTQRIPIEAPTEGRS